MNGYWWGLLTIPIALALLAAGLCLLLGAWALFWNWAERRFVHLQDSTGWNRPRSGEAAYIALAPRAWSIELARFCSLTIAVGKVKDKPLTQVAVAIQDAAYRPPVGEVQSDGAAT